MPTIEYEAEVPELPGWRFIKDDLFKIAEGVYQYEDGRTRLARYVADDGAWPKGQLGIMREFHGELDVNDPSKKKWWVIVVRCVDESGHPLTGTPDQRILKDMARYDTWSRTHEGTKQIVAAAHKIREHREKLEAEKYRERIDEDVTRMVREHKRSQSINDSVFISSKKEKVA